MKTIVNTRTADPKPTMKFFNIHYGIREYPYEEFREKQMRVPGSTPAEAESRLRNALPRFEVTIFNTEGVL